MGEGVKQPCPLCDGLRDHRAMMCKQCRMRKRPPRLGTGAARYVDANGYVRIRINRRPAYEHRHVMEQHIGRKLRRDEHVHHKNHDPQDNRLENLEVLSESEHHREHLTSERAKAMSLLALAAKRKN